MDATPGVRITERDHDILEHVTRYRITTREAIQRVFMPDHELNAASKVLSRLVKADFLSKPRLLPDGQTRYWRLSLSYVNAKGLHPYHSKALTFGPAIEHFGILAYCCLGDTERTLYTRQEFKELYPDHYDAHLLRSAYYLDVDPKSGVERLGIILVDSGRRDEMRWVRRFRQIYKRRLDLPGFRSRLRDRNKLFLIAFITPNADKLTAVDEAVHQAARSGDKWPVAFRFEVEPRLERMMVPYRA